MATILRPATLLLLLSLCFSFTSDAATAATGFYQYIYDGNNVCSGTPTSIRSLGLPNTCNVGNSSEYFANPARFTLSLNTSLLGTATFVQNCNTKELSPCGICQSSGTSALRNRFSIAVCTASTVKIFDDCNEGCSSCVGTEWATTYVYNNTLCPSTSNSEQNPVFGRPPSTFATEQTTTNTTAGVYFYASTTLFQNENCTGSYGGRVFGCNNSCTLRTAGGSSLFVCTGVGPSAGSSSVSILLLLTLLVLSACL